MSVRHAPRGQPTEHVTRLQKELAELKNAATSAPAADGLQTSDAATAPSFDDLSGVEKSAASLGVHPDSWRPIGFLNNAHFGALLANNQLDGALARRIEAYSVVAKSSA